MVRLLSKFERLFPRARGASASCGWRHKDGCVIGLWRRRLQAVKADSEEELCFANDVHAGGCDAHTDRDCWRIDDEELLRLACNPADVPVVAWGDAA